MSVDILSNLVITKVTSVTTMYNDRGGYTKRCERPSWAIVIKYEGETEYRSGGDIYVSNAENVAILPRGCTYEWRCTRPGHFVALEFDCDLCSDRIFTVPLKGSEKPLRIIKELEYKRMLGSPAIHLESIRDAYSVLLKLTESEIGKYAPRDRARLIEPALEHIAKHYKETVKNDELAALTGLSTVYFRKLFTEHVGRSPIDYALSLRIEKAKEMLSGDCGSMTEVALALGYQSIYDFSRSFKRHVGFSPTEYKRRAAVGNVYDQDF